MNAEMAPAPQNQESAPTGGEDIVSQFAALSANVAGKSAQPTPAPIDWSQSPQYQLQLPHDDNDDLPRAQEGIGTIAVPIESPESSNKTIWQEEGDQLVVSSESPNKNVWREDAVPDLLPDAAPAETTKPLKTKINLSKPPMPKSSNKNVWREENDKEFMSNKFVDQLNAEHPNGEPTIVAEAGASKSFRKAEEDFAKIGEDLFGKLTDAAKEEMGIRDAADLGEYLHEQFAKNAEAKKAQDEKLRYLIEGVNSSDEYLGQWSAWNHKNPVTGDFLPNYPYSIPEESKPRAFIKDSFVGKMCDEISVSDEELSLLMDIVDREEATDGVSDEEFLGKYEGAQRDFMEWATKGAGRQRLQQSPTYGLVKREMELWQDIQDGKDGSYIDGDGDRRGRVEETRSYLYKRVNNMQADRKQPGSGKSPLESMFK